MRTQMLGMIWPQATSKVLWCQVFCLYVVESVEMDEPLFLRLCFISDLKSRLSPVCVKGFRKTNTLYVIELKGGGLNWVYCVKQVPLLLIPAKYADW